MLVLTVTCLWHIKSSSAFCYFSMKLKKYEKKKFFVLDQSTCKKKFFGVKIFFGLSLFLDKKNCSKKDQVLKEFEHQKKISFLHVKLPETNFDKVFI